MLFQEYAPLARVTLKTLPMHEHLVHMGMGIVGEFGEIIDAMKKVSIYDKAVDPIHLMEEVGDVAWYLACYCEELQVHPAFIQTAFDKGFQDGTGAKLQQPMTSIMKCETVLVVAVAAGGAVVNLLDAVPASENVMQTMAALSQALGFSCAIMDVDITVALERNIAKLKDRYGGKFSEASALNRDLENERQTLEAVRHPV